MVSNRNGQKMPFKETSAMEEKKEFIKEWQEGGMDMSKLCRKYGVSRPTGYKWVERYESEGEKGLRERAKESHTHPNALAPEIETLIVEARIRYPTWGPKKLVEWVKQTHRLERVCAVSTAGAILQREGLSSPRKVHRRAAPHGEALAEYTEVNSIWCIDFKGHFKLGNGQRCDPLTLSDGYSRYLLRCLGMRSTGLEATKAVLEAAFRQYGQPERLRSDNGSPFGSVAIGGLSSLGIWLMKLGIEPERIRAGCPYQNGRHERMHLTLNEAIRPPAENHRRQQRSFNEFQTYYNQERPHEALQQRTPASCYRASPRAYTGKIVEPEYEHGLETRKVQSNGSFHWKGEQYFLSETLRRETIGLEEINDGQWALRYGKAVLGMVDEREKVIISTHGRRGKSRK
jgi:transposase InsO family protein